MSANYQYSRILLKRSGITGTTPTINTGSTDHTDGSWLATDLYEGELFLNTADDLMWVRTSNGILPINISGGSSSVTGGLNVGSGTQGVFAQNNAGVLEFYSFSAGSNVTITSGSSVITIASTGGGGSETAFTGLTGGLIKTIIGTAPVNQAVQDSITLFNAKATSAVTAGFAMGSPTYNKSYIGNYGSETGNINSSFAFGPGQDNVDKGVNASASVAISYQYWIKSGSTASGIIAGRQNTIGYDSNDSVIIGGSGNTINNSITGSTILGGSNITATALDTTYVPKLNIRNIGSSSPIINLGLDSSGNVVTGTTGGSITAGNYIGASGSTTISLTGVPCDMSFAISDETTQITTGTSKLTLYAPYGFTITDVQASLSQSGSATINTFNVKKNGTTIFSTKPTIDINEFHTSTALTPRVITGTSVSVYDKLTVDIDTIGTGSAGAKIYILGNRTL